MELEFVYEMHMGDGSSYARTKDGVWMHMRKNADKTETPEPVLDTPEWRFLQARFETEYFSSEYKGMLALYDQAAQMRTRIEWAQREVARRLVELDTIFSMEKEKMKEKEYDEWSRGLFELQTHAFELKYDFEAAYSEELRRLKKLNLALLSAPDLIQKAILEQRTKNIQKILEAERAVQALDLKRASAFLPSAKVFQVCKVLCPSTDWQLVYDASETLKTGRPWSLSPICPPLKPPVLPEAFNTTVCAHCAKVVLTSDVWEFLPYCSAECYPGDCKPLAIPRSYSVLEKNNKKRRVAGAE